MLVETMREISQAPVDENVRITRRIEIGHAVQQGDLYLHRVPDNHERGEQIGKDCVQIAMGVGNGARHMAEGAIKVYRGSRLPEAVSALEGVEALEIIGPLVVAGETWLLTHPEHPHHQLPAGTYQTTYQYDQRTMRRVAD